MKRPILGLCAALAITSPSVAAPGLRACDVKLNVTDPDPAGLNVRAEPAGRVIGTLRAKNQWVQVHVTGDAGGWMRIDGATLYDDALPEGEKTVFTGVGFVSTGMLGTETLNGRARLLAEARDDARLLYQAPDDTDKAPMVQVLGCSGGFLQLRVGKITGWTRGFCSNQRTTCV